MSKFNKYTKRVRAGIKYLNKTRPNWFKKIDLQLFDLSDASVCICGQLFGDFWNKVLDSYESPEKGKITNEQAVSMGFVESADDESDMNYDLLTNIWWYEISKLKSG